MNELLLNCCLCNKLRFRYSTSQSSVALMKWVENSQKLTNNSIFEWFSLVSEDGNSLIVFVIAEILLICLQNLEARNINKNRANCDLRGVKLIFDGSL